MSSREKGFVGVEFVGSGRNDVSFGEGDDPDSGVEDQSQPIVMCLLVVKMLRG